MEGEFQTRNERTRSVEDAERYKALETLKEFGLLIPIKDTDTFHGRLGTSDNTWTVDPLFVNHGNSTGNMNVNDRSTLYTTDAETAREFAIKRGRAAIRSEFRDIFQNRVRKYTEEERQAWLDRINAQAYASWKKLDPEIRPAHPRQNSLGQLESAGIINYEADSLAQATDPDERQALWNEIAEKYRGEVHEILAADIDATAIDEKFDPTKIPEDQRSKYFSALRAIAIPITEGSPVNFDARHEVEAFAGQLMQYKKRFVLSGDIDGLAKAAGVNIQTALQLASAYNARQIAISNPSVLAKYLLDYSKDIVVSRLEVEGSEEEVPVNLEYAERYMRLAHIVAAKQSINSATLDKKISSISFFDLEKIGTREQFESQRAEMMQRMGGLIDAFPPLVDRPLEGATLLRMLTDVHVKPERLLEVAKSVGDFGKLYESDAGNWEGYTLGQHTETVLRNFDENYADIIPVEYLTPIRLAILVHDLGKPIAVERHEKHKQKEYNLTEAEKFLKELNLPDNYLSFMKDIISEGSDFAFQLQMHEGDKTVQEGMNQFARSSLEKYLQTNFINDEQITSFIEICKIVQLCDGGAYTSMAITRHDKGKGKHRNAPSFNASFQDPKSPGKRDIQYRKR